MTSDILDEFRRKLREVAKRPNINGYKPYVGVQQDFHRSTKRGRVLLGGNRVGKTVSGAAESVWYLTGTHPYRRTPEPPIYGRGVSVDIEQGLGKIMLPEIQRWMPPSMLLNGSWEDSYNKSARVLELTNGSKMDFLTNEMSTDKHAGTSRNFCWWDEEPPSYIFNEDMLRLVDVNGDWWLTMTPLLGFTWVYNDYVRPIYEDDIESPTVDVFVGSTENNPHVSIDVLNEITAGMSEEEQQARKHGKFMAASGLVYPQFNRFGHIIPPIDPLGITQPVVTAMDHGLRHPTVWLWGYVDPEGRVIIFHEHYESEMTVVDHAAEIHRYEVLNGLKDKIAYRIGDPSIEQRTAQGGLSIRTAYAEEGLFIGLANNDQNAGINKVRAYFQNFGLFITEDCPNLIRELQSYRWDPWANRKSNELKKAKDTPQKKNDDACDTLRYWLMSRPNDEFAGYAGEVRAPFITEHSTGAPNEEGDYAYEDLETADQTGYHTILGVDW